MIIEVRGAQFENKGAQLMLIAILKQVAARFPNSSIALRRGAGTSNKNIKSINALVKVPMRKRRMDCNFVSYRWPGWIDNLLLCTGFVAEGAVDVVLDASGFAYSSVWGPGPLRASTSELYRYSKSAKPYIFLPQTYGPFDTVLTDAVKWGAALTAAPLIGVRDRQSMARLRALMTDSRNLRLYPDITLGLDPDPFHASQAGIDRGTALIIPNVRVLSKIPVDRYMTTLGQLASLLAKRGRNVRILNHGGNEDSALCSVLMGSLSNVGRDIKVVPADHEDPLALKSLISSSGLVVASRFHACVSSLSQGVPCLAISWADKYRELFFDYGCSENVVDAENIERAEDTLIRILDDETAPQAGLLEVAERQRLSLMRFWNEVFKAIAK